MKSPLLAACSFAAIALTLCWSAVPATAQSSPETGALDFEAHVAPSGGPAEPVRQLTFYLLRKDLAEIRKEAEQSSPPPDLDQFIDSLQCSSELKAWMKKTRIVEFTGTDFTKQIKTDDVLTIPEFLEAYKNLNGAILRVSLPKSPIKESDRTKNPEKYQRETESYQHALRQYIQSNPQSIDGLDAELGEQNPGRRWAQLQADRTKNAQQRMLTLAGTQYLAGKTISDLEGHGSFDRIAPGAYWITTLGVPALAGDARVEWDLPATVRPGQTTNVELSNLNATPRSEHMAQ